MKIKIGDLEKDVTRCDVSIQQANDAEDDFDIERVDISLKDATASVRTLNSEIKAVFTGAFEIVDGDDVEAFTGMCIDNITKRYNERGKELTIVFATDIKKTTEVA